MKILEGFAAFVSLTLPAPITVYGVDRPNLLDYEFRDKAKQSRRSFQSINRMPVCKEEIYEGGYTNSTR